MSLAIYRKYRPQSFKEVIGQEALVSIFQNAAKQNKLAHAYLFYGPRGTGKTTTARLVAKVANCQKEKEVAKTGEPCNKCVACKDIASGRAMDVIEIDAASNRGIDEIRNLKETIRLSPSSYRRKVFIIDETHMLTPPAFNALLKILEEPPEHAMIILATTEYNKVPATIISRTQRFNLHRITVSEIVGKLKKIIKDEKLKVSDEALELIAASAEGSLRDAESLLDQVTTLASEADLETVEQIIGRVGFKKVAELANYIITADLPGSLQSLAQVNESGANLTDLHKELLFYMRRVLALKLDPQLESIYAKELTKEDLIKLKEHAQLVDVNKQVGMIKSLIRAYSEMRYSPFPHIPIEIAIIENLGHN